MSKGNPQFVKGHRISVGNKGGRRMGYEFERDQLVRMRKAVDRALWTIEAIQKGQISDQMLDRYQKIQPTLLKLIDKLHASKQQTDVNVEINPIPLLDVLYNDSNKKNLPDVEAYPSLTGGDISGEDNRG